MRHTLLLQTVALKATGVHTNPQKDAATNPPIQGRRNTVVYVQAKQMLTELNNKCVKAIFKQESNSMFSVQSGISKVVPLCNMQGNGSLSLSHTHTPPALQ